MQGDAKEGRSTYKLLHDLDNVFAMIFRTENNNNNNNNNNNKFVFALVSELTAQLT